MRRSPPFFSWLRVYDRRWLAADALAGLSVWALLVPQSLAYATLSGVPVQYGLYTAFAALLAYPLFGTSKHLAEGPSAAVCAVCAAVITPIVGAAALGTTQAAAYAAGLAVATGVVYVALGVLRMGWVSTFLSKAVMAGFVLGFSIGIIIDQSHKLFGVTARRLVCTGAVGNAEEPAGHERHDAARRRGVARAAARAARRDPEVAARAYRHGPGDPGVRRLRSWRPRRGRPRRCTDRAVLGRDPGCLIQRPRPAARGRARGGVRRLLGVAGRRPVDGGQARI